MKALVYAGCAALLLLALSPGEAKADRSRHGHRSSYHVEVQIGGYGGYYSSGPVICDPPRPVYRPAPVYCPPPVVYCPPPVRYCPPPVYHRPVYHSQPVYRGHYHSGYRGGYSRHCDW